MIHLYIFIGMEVRSVEILNPAIQFEHVHYNIDGLHILKDINEAIPESKITTLVGPSGSGKTTLFRLCNGLESPSSGEIIINKKNINEYDPVTLRRKVGLALQHAPMVNGTVMDNLNLPLHLQGKQLRKDEAVKMLDLVGLDKQFLTHQASDLSGGQRQKVSIARTLVNRPDILLLDEITSALDRISQQEIEQLIMNINKQFGTTIIWITHNLEQAIHVGDYAWVMMDGQVVDAGDISILVSPNNQQVKQFVKGEQD